MMVAGIAQAACEKEQAIVDNPKGLSDASRIVWTKQLADCYEGAKEQEVYRKELAEKAKVAEAELAEKNKQKEAKWNSFKEPKDGSSTYWRDKYAQELGRNKLIEEEFGEQCLGRFNKQIADEYCLRSKNNKYQTAWMLKITKEMADEEPAQVAAEKKANAEAARLAKLPGVRIGMTSDQVIAQSSWGRPSSVNRTTTSAGTREQWVYGSRNYLYFTNGILTAIQN